MDVAQCRQICGIKFMFVSLTEAWVYNDNLSSLNGRLLIGFDQAGLLMVVEDPAGAFGCDKISLNT